MIGVRRMPCTRCGAKPSKYQWNSCANDNLWMPICEKCDILLNRWVLKFFRFPDRAAKLAAYIKRIRGT